MAKSLSQLEYEWLKAQPGVTSKFLGDMWTEYYESLGVEENDELGLLRYLIDQAGGTPKDTKFTSDLWFQYFKLLGYPDTKNLNEAFAKFYYGELNPLVLNGGFEYGTGSISTTGWITSQDYKWYARFTATGTASFDTTTYYNGSKSLKLDVTVSGTGQYLIVSNHDKTGLSAPGTSVSQCFPVKPNTDYTFSYWWKGTNVATNTGKYELISWTSEGVTGGVNVSATGTPSTSWAQVTRSITTGPNDYFISPYFQHSGNLNIQTIWFDDVRLVEG